MATNTYIALAEITLESASASVTFASIPNTYRDLILIGNFELTGSAGTRLRVNNNSSSIYYQRGIKGSSAGNEAENLVIAGNTLNPSSSPVTALSTYKMHFLDYSATNKSKTILMRNNIGGIVTEFSSALWNSSSAINEINIYQDTQQYAIGSTFTLFGVAG